MADISEIKDEETEINTESEFSENETEEDSSGLALPFVPDEETIRAEKRLQRSATALEDEIARAESREPIAGKWGRFVRSGGKSIFKKGSRAQSFLEKLGYDPTRKPKPSFIETHVHDSRKRIAIYITIIVLVIVLVVFKFTLFPRLGLFNFNLTSG